MEARVAEVESEVGEGDRSSAAGWGRSAEGGERSLDSMIVDGGSAGDDIVTVDSVSDRYQRLSQVRWEC